MNFLLGLAMKGLGLQKAFDALDGENSKAYIGGVGMIFGGIATIATGLAGLASEIMPLHGPAAYLSFAQGLGHDANSALVAAGYLAITQGYAQIGNRHATAKLAADVAEAVKVPDLPVSPRPIPAVLPALGAPVTASASPPAA